MKKTIEHPSLGTVVLQRTRQARRIVVSVRPDAGVRVTLPAACSYRAALAFLDSRIEWVLAARRRAEEARRARMLTDGYATRAHTLRFVTDHAAETVTVRVTHDSVTVHHPTGTDTTSAKVQQAARAGLVRALKAEARTFLPPLVTELSRRTGLSCGRVTIRATHSRWGSCSANNDLSLSCFLMLLPDHLIQYVIIHELCHTVHRDHSPRFHALVDSLVGGREAELAAELRRHTATV